MREFGADNISFDTIVAAGPNGAMVHHRPNDTVIQAGEPIVIDMGARVNGYCSDITRTVVVGEPDETFHKIYNIVLGAQLTAINTVRPGLTGEECDALSRDIIAEVGYGDNFGHSLGHGVRPGCPRKPPHRPPRRKRPPAQHGLHRRTRHLPPQLGRRPHRRHSGFGRGRGEGIEQG